MSLRKILKPTAKQIEGFAKDALGFGILTALKSIGRHFGKGYMTVYVRGVGSVAIRKQQSDFDTLRQCFRDKEYAVGNCEVEARILREYHTIIERGMIPVIVDAGANVGAASLWFRKEFPLATVVAIEPDAGNVEILKRNVGGDGKVKVMQAAIGSSPGFVAVQNNGAAWAITTERAEQGCPIITMDQSVWEVPDGIPFLAKIDIEGFEEDLFAKNVGWLDRTFAVFIEPHDWLLPGKHTSGSFQKAMALRDFELFMRGENLLYVKLKGDNTGDVIPLRQGAAKRP